MALLGEMGYPSALTAQTRGFQDVLFRGESIQLERPLGSYVMENVLFKLSFPAEFHAQTAVEAAMKLQSDVSHRLDDIEEIRIETQEAAVRIIDKSGPLANPADRDHCLQYMIAVPLIFGRLTADDYENEVAEDPRIDDLREKMVVAENSQFSTDYLDPEKRAIGNAITISFHDGTKTDRVAIDYPIGHRRRRTEGIPVLLDKFERNLRSHFAPDQVERILTACEDQSRLERMRIDDFMNLWVKTHDG
jgi:2-methylcitrate dehydratase